MSEVTRPFVVIPCLDEEGTIEDLLKRTLTHCADVIVIDDGSTDRTAEIAAQMPVTLIRHPERRGKGEALRAGFRAALERGADGILTMDGDGQHDPADIPRLFAAARRYPNALVVGARLLGREYQPNARRYANALADWGISWGCGQPIADTQSGQRWYPRAAAQLVDTPTQGFVFEAAILIAASHDLNMPVVSIPIANHYDANARHSHFRPVHDVLRIAWYTTRRVVHYGHIVHSYHASHDVPPTVLDPDLRVAKATTSGPANAAGHPPPAQG